MTLRIPTIFYQALAACLACVIAPTAWSQTVQIEDTFSRPDSDELGTTEVGGYSYLESGTVGPGNVADIFGEELVLFGTDGIDGTGPGLALIDGVEFTDATISADVRFEGLGLFGPPGTGSNNVAGFMFRRNGDTFGFGATNEGMVEVTMFPGGGFFIRETLASGLNTLYADNPWGLGGSTDNNYSAPGGIPTTFNGMPLDANGNGVLEDGEPFHLSASLIGNELDVAVNGMNVVSVNTTLSEPVFRRSTLGLYKNRFTSAGGLDPANMAYDNLVISGTEFVPEPLGPILHVGDNDPIDEDWLPQNAGTVGNNGPVDDNGTPAWNIQDVGTGRAAWTRDLTDDQVADALAEGWRYTASIKVLDLDDAPDGGIELSVFPDSQVGYLLWLGSDANGDTLVAEFGGVQSEGLALGRTATVPGMDYVDYEMVFDPATETVDVFANDALILDDMLPIELTTTSLNRILWGSNASGGSGNANYARVEFLIGDDTGSVLPGDYNEDGIVDAADYTVWRDALGATDALANDPIGGTIGAAQYDQWRNNFGATAPGAAGLSSAPVPEPAAAVLLAVGLVAAVAPRRRR